MVKCEPALVLIRKRKYGGIHMPTYSLPNSSINAKKLRQCNVEKGLKMSSTRSKFLVTSEQADVTSVQQG